MVDSKAIELLNRYDKLKGARSQWESYWAEVDTYFKPPKEDHVSGLQNKGTKYNPRLYASQGWRYADKCVNGFISNFINPATTWFKLGKNSELDSTPKDLLNWQDETTKIYYNIFENSNFYNETNPYVFDYLTIGNAVMRMDPDPKDQVIFETKSVTDFVFDEDYRRRPNTAFIKYKLSIKSAYDKFTDNDKKKSNLSESVIKRYNAQQFDDEIEFIEVITPRYNRREDKTDIKNKLFAKYVIEVEAKKIIEEGGLDYFPLYLLRSKRIANDLYAYGIGSSVLADLKTLNELIKAYVITTNIRYQPTYVVDTSIFNTPINLRPNGIIPTIRQAEGRSLRDQIFPLVNPDDPTGLLQAIEYYDNIIKDAFMVDMFTFLDTIPPNTTATQVMIMNQKNMTNLSSYTPIFIHDFLDPLMKDMFNVMYNHPDSTLTLPPNTVIDKDNKVVEMPKIPIDYVSPLAMSQKTGEISNTINYLNALDLVSSRTGNMAVWDNFDSDSFAQDGTVTYNQPSKYIKAMKVVKEERAIRGEQAQQMEQLAQLQQGANIAKTGAEAERAMTKNGK